jgi:hypothetical protein
MDVRAYEYPDGEYTVYRVKDLCPWRVQALVDTWTDQILPAKVILIDTPDELKRLNKLRKVVEATDKEAALKVSV